MLKEAIKRRKPDFNESYYGFRAFGNLLEEAQARDLLAIGRDEKSGTYVFRRNGLAATGEAVPELPLDEAREPPPAPAPEAPPATDEQPGGVAEQTIPRRKGEGRRKATDKGGKRGARTPLAAEETGAAAAAGLPPAVEAASALDLPEAIAEPVASVPPTPVVMTADDAQAAVPEQSAEVPPAEVGEAAAAVDPAAAPAARKPARPRRPRKPKVPVDAA